MPQEICKDHREQLQRIVSTLSAVAEENEFLGWLSGMNVIVMLLELVVLIAGIAHGNIPLILLDLLIILLHIITKLKEHEKHEKNAAKIARIETELQQKQASLLE